ncbi:TPA: thin pilus major pilin AcuA [Acinetobacter nosocomialis]|uniref:thin pilus major pilin AcuA n=1 Tax=Acinetobacter baumannii TaxID=470 RepID=UPI00056ED004|nr:MULTISPECIES: thin pilus major pilin AcuA [Acinetobacter]HAV4990415.1 thin pilus major pilin AcuA [Acinetobacter nosocomialis]EKT9038572.1 thin pilus major pilin AcuA [Acinetobacter baumannii]EKU1483546.1 thin pilus major pilin AcuA [Acinetobacter baumannii]EKU6934388.1 thin pilus major pilin AcuA [Acinetobacter baumannii]EKU7161689.1 thin pilus major pilin AcuA [Acinetobacter baumannii]
MKKLNLALLATILCAAGTTTSVFATDGTITINGRVITSTCTLSGSGAAGSGTQNVNVILPTVPNSAFAAANSTAQATNFNLSLTNSAGTAACDAVTIAGLQGITLGGPTNASQYVSGSTTRLVNTVSGSTVNVQLKLASVTTPIDFALTNQLTNSNATTTTSGIWNVQAQYFSPTATPAAQQVNSVVNYILNYN